MALRMQTQTGAFTSYSDVDLVAQKIARIKTKFGYSHPAELTFEMHVPQHTMPIPPGTFIRFWDDEAPGQSASAPHFEGFVANVDPGDDANLVNVTAYDPTQRASITHNVFNLPWPQGTVPDTPPVPNNAGVPRLVFNSKIDSDDDYAYERAHDADIKTIIETILTDQYHPLYWVNAAPGDGTNEGNDTAWEASDISAMTAKPQEKLVFESETVRSAIERVLQWYPSTRILWEPGTRKWRIRDLRAAPEVTLRLNDFGSDTSGTGTGNWQVLSMQLNRSLDGRYTATKIYGPETLANRTASTANGLLAPVTGAYTVLERIGGVEIRAYSQYQITNDAYVPVAARLSAPLMIPMGGYRWIQVAVPTLQASWDGGNTWISVRYKSLDFANGRIDLGGPMFFYSSDGVPTATGTQNYFPPTDVRFVYAHLSTPISIRVPSSGFAGSAYDDVGLETEQSLYDEMLAVGYEWGIPVTTATRLAQYSVIAQAIHQERRDIIYTGGAVLDGLQYDFAGINRIVNITAVDENGDALTTGWEDASMFLTDVEFDFEDQLTTLTFSSDQLELMGTDVEGLKKQLGVKALERRVFINHQLIINKEWVYNRFIGRRFLRISGGVITTTTPVWVDPDTGAPG